ncbi:MAG: hypothetical protein QOE58_1803 [Actinomycetota bacterium]|nr:hypothetical protein [Actinomycetota bacterium]
MSPLRLLLEGPDLPTLLEQVRTEYGDTARIIQAEKVRRGGVGGFFARECFNIQVEVPEAHVAPVPEPAEKPEGRGVVTTVMDLVDRLNDEEQSLYQDGAEHPHSLAASTAASAYTGLHQSHAPLDGPSATTDERAPLPSASVSTQSAAFTDVMSRLQHSIDPGVPALTDLSSMVDTRGEEAVLRSTMLSHAPKDPPPPPVRRRGDRGSRATGALMASRAIQMGVPRHTLVGVEDPADVYRRLLNWVESRPMAPMIASTPGQVIVVVGELKAAMEVASSLARQLGVDPAATLVAVSVSSTGYDVPAGLLLSDVSDMAMRRQRWQHSVGGTIVVVEAALPPAARGWLAAVVSALAPTFTWAVAQASTKVNDVVSWAGAVGQVDALALMNVSATADPATSLAGPLPIGLLDGQRATVTRWMAMLTEEGGRR